MEIFITTTLIVGITLIVWGFSRLTTIAVCPICAGISGTWLILLSASMFGVAVDLRIPAILMGGSVVGIAYQLEKRLREGRSALLFKALFMPAGFLAVYAILLSHWMLAIVALTALLAIALTYREGAGKKSDATKGQVEELERKMKDCC